MVSKEHILAEIRRTAAENAGRVLGCARFEAETGIRQYYWSGRYWAKWSDAVTEAGFEPNRLHTALPEAFLLECLVSIIQDLGRFPTVADITLKSRLDPVLPNQSTFDRLGPKSERAWRILQYCEERGNLSDVAELCRPIAIAPSIADGAADEPQPDVLGFVYLMKSGRYYKIGRSVCAEKRAYEVQLVLPEELRLVHKIKTDDPIGIEAYWHARFASKRLRGEWFDLSAEDVGVFRRRKFM